MGSDFSSFGRQRSVPSTSTASTSNSQPERTQPEPAIISADQGNRKVQGGDRICAAFDGKLRYGVISIPSMPRLASRSKRKRTRRHDPLVLWDGSSVKTKLNRQQRHELIDRKFSLGQKVTAGTHSGTIIGISQFSTLFIHDTDQLLATPVRVQRVRPLTKLFHGVCIEYLGWFGVIQKLVRQVVVELEGNIRCNIYRKEPGEMSQLLGEKFQSKTRKKTKRLLNRNYPFITNTVYPTDPELAYPGANVKYSMEFLRKNGFRPDSSDLIATPLDWDEVLGNTSTEDLKGTVLSSEVLSIFVDWFTNITALPVGLRPNLKLSQDEIKGLRYFYIHPCQYFFKDGLCEYDLKPVDVPIHQEQFNEIFMARIKSENDLSDGEKPDKFFRFNTIDLQGLSKVIVKKHLLLHAYDVRFDETGEVNPIRGADLEPVLNDPNEINVLVQPPFFVRKKGFVARTEDTTYGVVLQHRSASGSQRCAKFIVQWLREVSGLVAPLDIVEEDFFKIDFHKEYNELLVGTHVSRATGTLANNSNGFLFGTVLKIDRYNCGQVTVYCSVDQTEKHLWPFELQIIKYDKPIANMVRVQRKSVSTKPHSPRQIDRGPDGLGRLDDPFKEKQGGLLWFFGSDEEDTETENSDTDEDETKSEAGDGPNNNGDAEQASEDEPKLEEMPQYM